jgi:hypothetical protein
MSISTDVLVIGAGPAGLTAAYMLTKHGRGVMVLESDPALVGGISRTVNHKGFLFDIGGHRFFSKSREVVDLWDEILPHDFIERPRLSRIYYKGKFYSYPLKAFEALTNLGIFQSAACVASYLLRAPGRSRTPKPSTNGSATSSASGCSRSSSRPTPKGVGHVLRRHLGRLGGPAHQGARPRGGDPGRLDAVAEAETDRPGRRRHQDADRVVPLPAARARNDVGVLRKQDPGAGRADRDGPHRRRLVWDAARGVWHVSALRVDGVRETYTARDVISSAPIRDLVQALTPAPISTFHARR